MSDEDKFGDVDALFDDIVSHWDDARPDAPAGEATVRKDVNPPPRIRFEPRHPDDPDGAGPAAAGPGREEQEQPGQSPEDTAGDTPGSGAAVAPEGEDRAAFTPPSPLEQAAGAGGDGWRIHPVDEPEEHFVPPAPSPLPAGDLQFWAILVGMIGGPLLFLYLVLFDRDASDLWIGLALILSLGGFGLLVARLPRHRDESDGDDGARL